MEGENANQGDMKGEDGKKEVLPLLFHQSIGLPVLTSTQGSHHGVE